MTDRHDQLRIAPDPVRAEELRQRLRARLTSAVPDDGRDRSDLRLAQRRFDAERWVEPVVELPLDVPGGGDRRHRHRWWAAAAAVVVVTGAAAVVIAVSGDDEPARVGTDVTTPTVAAARPGDAAVWYDARGLHRGDVVEQVPVEIALRVGEDSVRGALALVQSGVLYWDPPTREVWFHPWGGAPRIVGRGSAAGPGGDPDGDTAAWFEGSELVVYDTAAGRETSRTDHGQNVAVPLTGDHRPAGNSFLEVSAERVVWYGGVEPAGPYSHDLRTGTTSVIEGWPLDVHGESQVLGSPRSGSEWVLEVPGRDDVVVPDLEPRARLSPSGDFVLAVEYTDERHAAVIVETGTGELWQVPVDAYPWIAWSYGDVALVDTAGGLFACDAAARACEPVDAERPVLMPTN